MKKIYLFSLVVLMLWPASAQSSPQRSSGLAADEVVQHELHLGFIPNLGQWPAEVRFQVTGAAYPLWLTNDSIWLSVRAPELAADDRSQRRGLTLDATNQQRPQPQVDVQIKFLALEAQAQLVPIGQQRASISYLKGNNPAAWQLGVPIWEGVRYQGLYPGTDLEITGFGSNRLPQFQLISSQAMPSVGLEIRGATNVTLNPTNLALETALGDVAWPLFLSNQQGSAPRLTAQRATQTFVVEQPLIKPSAAAPDASSTMDLTTPAAQEASAPGFKALLGGSSDDEGRAITVYQGNIFVTGRTLSTNFPNRTGYNSPTAGGTDAFVAKLSSDGKVGWAAIYGGSNTDRGEGIAITRKGEIVIAGSTNSPDLPLSAGMDQYAGSWDAFMLRLSADGKAVRMARYLGGTGADIAYGLVLDPATEAAYITGSTNHQSFPDGGTYNGGTDLFLTKISTSGGKIFSRVIGGSANDYGFSLKWFNSSIYLTGSSNSANFPTTSGVTDQQFGGGVCNGSPCHDAIVLKLRSDTGRVTYATYVGGSNDDNGFSIAVDPKGQASIGGVTRSSNFPVTPGALNPNFEGEADGFIATLGANARSVVFATYIGGKAYDDVYSLAHDGAFLWLTGESNTQVFIMALNDKGRKIRSVPNLGGEGIEYTNGIALGRSGAFITGRTTSRNFSLGQAYQGGGDAFVIRIRSNTSTLQLPLIRR